MTALVPSLIQASSRTDDSVTRHRIRLSKHPKIQESRRDEDAYIHPGITEDHPKVQ